MYVFGYASLTSPPSVGDTLDTELTRPKFVRPNSPAGAGNGMSAQIRLRIGSAPYLMNRETNFLVLLRSWNCTRSHLE